MAAYWVYFILPLVMSYALTLIAAAVGRRLNWMDVPSRLSIHAAPIPRTGGLAITTAFAVTIAIAWLRGMFDADDIGLLTGIIFGDLLIVVTGFVDDVRGLSPAAKFLGESIGAAIAVAAGLRLDVLPVFGVSLCLAFLYLVGTTNALNLMDGMNGLAAGVAVIAALFFCGLAFLRNSGLALILSTALLGSILGFLPLNFPRARVFMGDGGSLFLGFALASVGLIFSNSAFDFIGLLAALLIIGLPALDTCAAMLRRLSRGGDLFSGDRDHLYDLLARRLGGNVRGTVLTWAWAGAFGLTGVAVGTLPLVIGGPLTLLLVSGSIVAAARLGAFGAITLKRAGGAEVGISSLAGERNER